MRDDLGLYRHLCFVSVHNISLHCVPKNWTTKLIAVTLSNLNRFSKLFTVRLSDKFAIKVIVKDPTTPKTRCYPTLWNMSSRNRHAQELHEQTIGLVETTTHTRFSHWKLLSKNTHQMMWAICNSLTRRYLLSNSQNNWLYAAAATKKKDFTAKSFHTLSTFSHSLWRC